MVETSNAKSDGAYVPIGVAAAKLEVSVDTVRRWCDAGELRFWRTPGGQRRVKLADLDGLIARGAEPDAEGAA